MIKELVKKNRSYRRFYQEKKLTRQQLMELVETARLTPSAANRQPFKYRIVCDEEENEKVFRLLGFAGYLKDWDGPSEGPIVLTTPSPLKIPGNTKEPMEGNAAMKVSTSWPPLTKEGSIPS